MTTLLLVVLNSYSLKNAHLLKIIECSFRDGRWQFIRERTDKSYPNAKETAFGALRALQDPVTKELLCSLIDHYLRHNVHHNNS